MKKSEARQKLIELYQRTIDYEDPNRQYIGFMADKSIEIVEEYLASYVKLPMTMQQVAEYCGVTRQTVYSWVKSPESIKLKHLSKLMELEARGEN